MVDLVIFLALNGSVHKSLNFFFRLILLLLLIICQKNVFRNQKLKKFRNFLENVEV